MQESDNYNQNNGIKSYKNDGFSMKVTVRENNLNARKPVFNTTTSTKFNASNNLYINLLITIFIILIILTLI